MNLLLLEPHEVDGDGIAVLRDRRLVHAREVLRVNSGDAVTVGVRDGLLGVARVLESQPTFLRLLVQLDAPPPRRPGIDLVLAIPRPKTLKRVLPAVASLGVDRVMLVNSARVEKSYFDSKVLAAEPLRALCDLGLEQGKDTVAPVVEVRTRFRPFVEDELDAWCGTAARWVLHPHAERAAAVRATRLVLAIGPDGGWVPFEVELLRACGFMPLSLGPRTLRVDVAVPTIIGAFCAPSFA